MKETTKIAVPAGETRWLTLAREAHNFATGSTR